MASATALSYRKLFLVNERRIPNVWRASSIRNWTLILDPCETSWYYTHHQRWRRANDGAVGRPFSIRHYDRWFLGYRVQQKHIHNAVFEGPWCMSGHWRQRIALLFGWTCGFNSLVSIDLLQASCLGLSCARVYGHEALYFHDASDSMTRDALSLFLKFHLDFTCAIVLSVAPEKFMYGFHYIINRWRCLAL